MTAAGMTFDGIGMTSRRTRDRLIRRIEKEGICGPEVLAAMRSVPRHIFLDEALAHRAYEDTALPIGCGQTISQPYIVALMTELITEGKRLSKVLEIGTGSGYQAAVLAHMSDKVCSVERVAVLQRRARQKLRELRLKNVFLKHADGSLGWPEQGPFDGILVTAAPAAVPEKLFAQLVDGGRLVIPVGVERQDLYVYRKEGDAIDKHRVEAVRFVPLLEGVSTAEQ